MMASVAPFLKDLKALKAQVLVACSAGVDSTVLLHLLWKEGLAQGVVHLHFGLRQEEAQADADHVAALARHYDLPLHSRKVDTAACAEAWQCSIQMAARDLRYLYFQELLQTRPYTHVALAHHQDDSAETFLINLQRGTGLAGLSGIPAYRDRYVRPLSQVSRQAIENYARQEGLSWREDSSNQSTTYLRNRVRLEVLPHLRRQLPGWDRGLARSMQYLAGQQEALHYFLQELLDDNRLYEEKSQRLPLAHLAGRPYAAALLHYWLAPYGPWDWKALEALPTGQPGKQWESPSHLLLEDRAELILYPRDTGERREAWLWPEDSHLQQPLALQAEWMDAAKAPYRKAAPRQAYLAAEKLTWPLHLRPMEAGDRFKPLGMKGEQKLSDFLINQKVNRHEKAQQYVLCSGTDIVWVVGRRIHEDYKVQPSTKTVYFVALKAPQYAS
jgi:tRNA(Ile)-lysidine synthase